MRYNEETIEAIGESIAKWEGVVKGTIADEGGKNCPLCILCVEGCDDCPIYVYAGYQGECIGTPYHDFVSLAEVEGPSCFDKKWAKTAKAKEAANKMLEFLRMLLIWAKEDWET